MAALARRLDSSRVAAFALAAGAVLLLSFADGGFFEDAWPPATIAFASAALLAVAVAPTVAPSRAERLFVAALAAVAAWLALSATWSLVPGDSLVEAKRALVYVAAAPAFLLVARAGGAGALLAGVLAGAAAVCAYSVTRRVAAPTPNDPLEGPFLNEPLGYANALGLLAALALVLAVGAAAGRRRAALVTLAAVAPLSFVTLALTESRGSWLAAALGLTTVAVFRTSRAPRTRALWLGLVGIALAAVLAAPLVVDLVALERRLSDRPYYWWTAWHAVADRPLLGWGAGTFDELWAVRAPVYGAVRDAHSLYLESLVEVGPGGLALVALALLVPLAVAVRASSDVGAAAAGAYAAFVFHAGVDWDWELPAVTVAGLACGAAILVDAGARAQRKLSRREGSV